MCFYLDEDLPDSVAARAREQGIDVVTSSERGRNGLPDDMQLRLAAQEGRCLVTRNRNHFIRLSAQFFAQQWPHTGVLIVTRSLPNHDVTRLTRALLSYARRYEGDVPVHLVDFLSADPTE